MNNCEKRILPALTSAISDQTIIKPDDGDCQVVVPLERSDRDAVRLWISDRADGYRISDEGETYGYLYLSNVNLDTDSRSNRLESVKEQYSLDTVHKTISLTAEENELGPRLLDAIQAVQAVSYLSYTRKQYTQADFETDVGGFLKLGGIEYTRYARVSGISEDVRVDFSILNQPQPTYLEAIHTEDESTSTVSARNAAYKWNEIHEANENAMTIAVTDDESGAVSSDAEKILTNWSDMYIPWSQREMLTESLKS